MNYRKYSTGLYEVRILELIEAQGVGGFGHSKEMKGLIEGRARERMRAPRPLQEEAEMSKGSDAYDVMKGTFLSYLSNLKYNSPNFWDRGISGVSTLLTSRLIIGA